MSECTDSASFSIKTSTGRIIRLDRKYFAVRRSRRTSK